MAGFPEWIGSPRLIMSGLSDKSRTGTESIIGGKSKPSTGNEAWDVSPAKLPITRGNFSIRQKINPGLVYG